MALVWPALRLARDGLELTTLSGASGLAPPGRLGLLEPTLDGALGH